MREKQIGRTSYLFTRDHFTGYADVNPGLNILSVIAQDYSGNARTNNYQVTVAGGVPQTLAYDLNGNLVTISNATTVISNVWDAANRLVAIYSNSTYHTEFTYDGLSRRVRQIEMTGSTTNSDVQLVWCGTELCQERQNGGATVSKLFFPQGEKIGPVKFFYTRDHLGSIREMTEQSKGLRTRYDYDPWGRRVNVNGGDVEADFGFTGHYYHAPSGLHLALYRAYSAELGRWLIRDPLKNAELLQGPNLYAYVTDDPVNLEDCSGEFADPPSKETIEVCITALAASPVEVPIGAIIIGTAVVCGVTYLVYKLCKKKPKKEQCDLYSGEPSLISPGKLECNYRCKSDNHTFGIEVPASEGCPKTHDRM